MDARFNAGRNTGALMPESRDHDGTFEAYVRSSWRWLHQEANRLCGDWYEAEDLAQMTLHKIYDKWDRLTQQDQLMAYTRRTLLNTYISQHRRLRCTHEVARAELPDRACTGNPTIDDRITLLKAVQRLGDRQRAVVILRFWNDLSVEQTAQVLGCSVGTVASQTHRALNTLRIVLGESI
jgi:RNA polymerase sigma-70 factor (sigma-E family)